ncbi:type II secretion system F family protein [Pigmentiphaga aceris]|uniref:Type II secretion system F family protein n=1 Tax=Pigmentiphaga aceris TaxID=1940612 RepID=A0A5C0AYY4_9BURK|nr:type II secretion system F family protein [Pigmentiphaga aceris]QEI05647.1 type II secretion system F family protein [Pigmentiphaga aceris]
MVSAYVLSIISLLLLALAVGLAGGSMVLRAARQQRSRQSIDKRLNRRATPGASRSDDEPEEGPATRLGRARARALQLGKQLSKGRVGELLLTDEERQLLTQSGFNRENDRSIFALSRAGLALGLPIVIMFVLSLDGLGEYVMAAFFGLAFGLMLPKWYLRRRAARRRVQAADELPLLIDLMRLLQGVGLSIDQSLHIIVQEFKHVLPILSGELALAAGQYARGRTREQSLTRVATLYNNDDLAALVGMIVQVDRHGGAVQEPLQRFGERLREQRKLDLKMRVGKLTVKMTGVMVVTLLPALIVVTGGAGFLALFRGLSKMGL